MCCYPGGRSFLSCFLRTLLQLNPAEPKECSIKDKDGRIARLRVTQPLHRNLLAICVRFWNGEVNEKGEPLESSPAATEAPTATSPAEEEEAEGSKEDGDEVSQSSSTAALPVPSTMSSEQAPAVASADKVPEQAKAAEATPAPATPSEASGDDGTIAALRSKLSDSKFAFPSSLTVF